MDFKKTLEEIATANTWASHYQREDFQNLAEGVTWVEDALDGMADNDTAMFIDPIVRGTWNQGTVYSGRFMVLTVSDLDMQYEEKFTKYIEPLLAILTGKRNVDKLLCMKRDVEQWSSKEVINMLDWNADGLLITYKVKGYD